MRVVWLRGRCWWVAGLAGSAGCPEPLSNGQDQMCGIEGRPPDQRVFGTPSGFNVPKRPSQTRVTVHDQVCESCCSSHTSAGGSELGYARVSSASQNLDGQDDALRAVGCEKVFADTASGTLTQRPELAACLGYLRAGDTLVVWRLDRLGRSLRHLVETVNGLAERGVAFRSLHEGIDTTTSTGRLIFHI